MDAKTETVNIQAINDVEVPGRFQIMSQAFLEPSDQPLIPIILRFHAVFADEPERILAFFLRDNPHLVPHACNLMGLHVLEWGESMVEDAVDSDNFAQMMVLILADQDVLGDDPSEAFREAVEDETYGRAIVALSAAGDDVVQGLGAEWVSEFLKLTQRGNGMPYLTAQLLAGAMVAHAPEIFEAGVKSAAEGICKQKEDDISLDSTMGYLRAMGQAFNPPLIYAMQHFVRPKWNRY